MVIQFILAKLNTAFTELMHLKCHKFVKYKIKILSADCYQKKKLLQKINNNKVDCKKKAVDRYKRIVAECFVNNQSLSSYLVKNGYAFAYKKYSKQFVEDEMFAKKNRLGLWAMEFQYPWDYRRNK